MAHEATHVAQQRAAGLGGGSAAKTPDVQPMLSDRAIEALSEYAEYIPGWTPLTIVLGKNPITREEVDHDPATLFKEVIELVPGGEHVTAALREFGIFDRGTEWIESRLEDAEELDLSIGRFVDTARAALDDLGLGDLLGSAVDSLRSFEVPSVGEDVLSVLDDHFGPLYDDVTTFANLLVDGVIDIVREAAVGVAERLLPDVPAWELLTKVMARDPLRGVEVEASTAEILEDFLLLVGADDHLEMLQEKGLLEKAADWLDRRIDQFGGLVGQIGGLVDDVFETIRPENLPDLRENVDGLAADIGAFLEDIAAFAGGVAGDVLGMIKDALLGRLDAFATENLPGFELLTVILEQNPFTGERVARTAEALIAGFIALLPGGREVYAELSEAGVVEQAGERIDAAVTQLGISWEFVTGLFTEVWADLEIEDLLDPLGAFQRVVDAFGDPIARLVRFVSVVLQEVFTVALAAMRFPSDLIGSIVSNVMEAIDDVRSDPVGFLENLLSALQLGFENFFDDITSHLVGGVTDWLFGGLQDAGLQPPTDLSLGSVFDFVLEVLGVSMDRLWGDVADRIGQEKVDRITGAVDKLSGIWSFVQDVKRDGIGAIWEHVTSQIRGLWDTVLGMAREWIVERIVPRAIQWLAGLLDPTGVTAVINSFQAFFNAAQSAMEYFRDVLGIVDQYVSTVASVARGELSSSAETLEGALSDAIPVAIGFLANQFGLGNIGQRIEEIVGEIRSVIDDAVEWLLDRAERALERILGIIGLGGDGKSDEKADEEDDEATETDDETVEKDEEATEGDDERVETKDEEAAAMLGAVLRETNEEPTTRKDLKETVSSIQTDYSNRVLRVEKIDDEFHVEVPASNETPVKLPQAPQRKALPEETTQAASEISNKARKKFNNERRMRRFMRWLAPLIMALVFHIAYDPELESGRWPDEEIAVVESEKEAGGGSGDGGDGDGDGDVPGLGYQIFDGEFEVERWVDEAFEEIRQSNDIGQIFHDEFEVERWVDEAFEEIRQSNDIDQIFHDEFEVERWVDEVFEEIRQSNDFGQIFHDEFEVERWVDEVFEEIRQSND